MTTSAPSALRWEKRFETGDARIDFEHQVLFALMNELYGAAIVRDGSLIATEALAEFCSYANQHFHAEEELMSSLAYPGYRSHAECHNELRERIHALSQSRDLSLMDVCLFSYDWLIQHIVAVDLPFIKYARSRGLDSSRERHSDDYFETTVLASVHLK